MKIEVEVPDWYEGRHIYVFAGIEQIAKRPVGKPWAVKTARCSQCGECCKNLGAKWPLGLKAVEVEKDGKKVIEMWCSHLIYYAKEYLCDMLIRRPFYCCIGDNSEEKHCAIEWREVE